MPGMRELQIDPYVSITFLAFWSSVCLLCFSEANTHVWNGAKSRFERQNCFELGKMRFQQGKFAKFQQGKIAMSKAKASFQRQKSRCEGQNLGEIVF